MSPSSNVELEERIERALASHGILNGTIMFSTGL
jgi:hypothetical protein